MAHKGHYTNLRLYLSYIFTALSAFFTDLTPFLGCLIAAIHLHRKLLHGILRTPLSFFDTTPTGRILSRFSKDIDVVDVNLPHYISDTLYCLFEVN